MQKVTKREFRAKLSHYLAIIESGEALDVGGLKLTVYTECVHTPKTEDTAHTLAAKDTLECEIDPKSVYTKEEKLKVARAALAQAEGNKVCTQHAIIDGKECDKCGDKSNTLIVWEDGEEYNICQSCIKRGKHKGGGH